MTSKYIGMHDYDFVLICNCNYEHLPRNYVQLINPMKCRILLHNGAKSYLIEYSYTLGQAFH